MAPEAMLQSQWQLIWTWEFGGFGSLGVCVCVWGGGGGDDLYGYVQDDGDHASSLDDITFRLCGTG